MDGLIPLEHFMDIRNHSYQQPHVDPRLLNRTQAFTADFDQYLIKAYQRLRNYNYGSDAFAGVATKEDLEVNAKVHEILEQTEGYIQ